MKFRIPAASLAPIASSAPVVSGALILSLAVLAPVAAFAQAGPVGTAGARRANAASPVTGAASPVTETPNPEPGTAAKPGTPNPEPGTAESSPTNLAAKVQSLYASASYEEALAAMPAPDSGVSRDVEQYRALCLLALGRQPEAAASVARVVAQDPLFVPPAGDTPPRLEAMYKQARVRLAPGLAKAAYADAKAAWEKKDRAAAHTAFQRTVDIIALVPDAGAAGLTDLRELASGFVMLTGAAGEAGAPSASPAGAPGAGAAATASMAAANPGTASSPAAGLNTASAGKAAPAAGAALAANSAPGAVVPSAAETAWQGPVAIRQDMPVWQPPDPGSRRLEYHGRVRISIDSTGHVNDVRVLKPSHPAYDASVVRATRLWSFTPAMRGGRPIESTKEIDINLIPQ